jgi:hypothetical protein
MWKGWLTNRLRLLIILNVVTYFWVPAQKGENTKNYIWKKNQKNNKQWKEDAKAPRKWLKIGWGGLKIEELEFDRISLTDEGPTNKENSIWERNVQNQMFIRHN